MQYKNIILEEGGAGTVIRLLSACFLCVVCDNDENRADRIAEYRTQDYSDHSSPMSKMRHLFEDIKNLEPESTILVDKRFKGPRPHRSAEGLLTPLVPWPV